MNYTNIAALARAMPLPSTDPARLPMMPAANLRRSFMTDKTRKIDTILTHAGSDPAANFGVINPPVYRASTVIHPTMQSLEDRQKDRFARGNISYGRHGTPTTFAFEDAV